MKLGIISDTHDELSRTKLAVSMLQEENVDAIVHCGDFIRAEILTACAIVPCYFVFGNNDADNTPDLKQAGTKAGAICLEWGGTFQMNGKRIGVTHGHMRSDLRRVLESEPDYLLTGHSHMMHDRREGSVRRINPGALRRASEYTVATLDVQSDVLKFLYLP